MYKKFLTNEITFHFTIGTLLIIIAIIIIIYWLYSSFQKWNIGIPFRSDIWNPFYRIPDEYKSLYRKGWTDKKNLDKEDNET